MGVAINWFAVREMVALHYGATFLSISCCLLDTKQAKIQLKIMSLNGYPSP